jgi:kynurenine 3-monooxygenase
LAGKIEFEMPKAIIVGGGLVGSVLAMYLTKAGWNVKVFERNDDPRQTAVKPGRSINLTLCYRGFNALAEIGAENLVRDYCVPACGRLIHDLHGAIAPQAYGCKGEAIYSIARDELNRLLLDHSEQAFRIRVQFNQKCVEVNPAAPSVTFEDTHLQCVTEEQGDVIFGVDGAHSTVRRQMQHLGLLTQDEQYWEQGYKEINVPAPSREDNDWRSRKHFLHFWPRVAYMLIGFPNLAGDFTCALHLPFYGDISFQSARTEQEVVELFRQSFPDVLPYVNDLGPEFLSRPVNRMFTVRCSPWNYEGKILLVGDAAHAIYPSYGQGANAGFEDCRILERTLAANPGNWRQAFRDYEQERRPSMDAIADLCVEHFIEIRDRVGDPRFQRRKEVERRVSEMFPDRYSPLYSNITFTNMSYAEALRVDRQDRPTIDRIMQSSLGGDDLDEVIRQVMQ